MIAIELTCVAGLATSLAYYVAAVSVELLFAERGKRFAKPVTDIPPKVAIPKPLASSSDRLLGNLSSCLELPYRNIDYIFGVSSGDGEATEVLTELCKRYESAAIAVVAGEEPGLFNRKVAKLVRMAEHASVESGIFLLSDADVSVKRDHLDRMAAEMTQDRRVGIVTCRCRGRPTGGFASRMATLFINLDFARQILLAQHIEPMRYAFGATIAVGRKALDAIGGFRPLRAHRGEGLPGFLEPSAPLGTDVSMRAPAESRCDFRKWSRPGDSLSARKRRVCWIATHLRSCRRCPSNDGRGHDRQSSWEAVPA